MATDTGTWDTRATQRERVKTGAGGAAARWAEEKTNKTKLEENGSLEMSVRPCGADLLGVW